MKSTSKILTKTEDDLSSADNSNTMPPVDIVTFNELRSCADLYRMVLNNQIEISPKFQRGVVWKNDDQTRFIDSLAKQLPIPSMCFGYDYKKEKRIVIDGLQRMTAIIKFLGVKENESDSKHTVDNWCLSKLDDVDEQLSGKWINDIKEQDENLFSRIQNTSIPVTVIRCDLENKNHAEYIYKIFHRLNSGGIKLNNQEIRNCIYTGRFNDLINDLAKDKLSIRVLKKKERFVSQEMILRFFAFFDNISIYTWKLSSFLNDYMYSNRYLSDSEIIIKSRLYNDVLNFIIRNIIPEEKLPLSRTILEGLLYGIAKNIETLKFETELLKIKTQYTNFINSEQFNPENLKYSLSDKDKVIKRLSFAENCFSSR